MYTKRRILLKLVISANHTVSPYKLIYFPFARLPAHAQGGTGLNHFVRGRGPFHLRYASYRSCSTTTCPDKGGGGVPLRVYGPFCEACDVQLPKLRKFVHLAFYCLSFPNPPCSLLALRPGLCLSLSFLRSIEGTIMRGGISSLLDAEISAAGQTRCV